MSATPFVNWEKIPETLVALPLHFHDHGASPSCWRDWEQLLSSLPDSICHGLAGTLALGESSSKIFKHHLHPAPPTFHSGLSEGDTPTTQMLASAKHFAKPLMFLKVCGYHDKMEQPTIPAYTTMEEPSFISFTTMFSIIFWMT